MLITRNICMTYQNIMYKKCKAVVIKSTAIWSDILRKTWRSWMLPWTLLSFHCIQSLLLKYIEMHIMAYKFFRCSVSATENVYEV
jgi:hypothetical protein